MPTLFRFIYLSENNTITWTCKGINDLLHAFKNKTERINN